MTLTDYSELKQKIVIGVGESDKHGQLLNMLKKLFKDEINSPRRFEQIKTIGQLLEILEIRDILSEDNITIMKHIAERLTDSEQLLDRIKHYETTHIPKTNLNYYAQQNIPEQVSNESSFLSTNPTASTMSARKKERIYARITEGIGSNWKDLARNLGIRECRIDELNISYSNVLSKATKVLEEYETTRADPQRWFLVLCTALEKSRRRDLSRIIREIETMSL